MQTLEPKSVQKGFSVKLTKEEVVTIEVLRLKGETNRAIAARMGISEGTVRYHRRRQAQQASDGRAKISLVESLQLVEVVDHWHADQLESLPQGRSPNLNILWTLLVDE